ncbi:hypothetical protein BH11CYA1_BH11CYA1_47720 [soil metagenome]
MGSQSSGGSGSNYLQISVVPDANYLRPLSVNSIPSGCSFSVNLNRDSRMIAGPFFCLQVLNRTIAGRYT